MMADMEAVRVEGAVSAKGEKSSYKSRRQTVRWTLARQTAVSKDGRSEGRDHF
jgi:hypothetical protein